MHPRHWATVQPQAPAIIMAGSGETVNYAELEAAANRGAQLLRRLGLRKGDVFALWSGNNPRFLEIAWAMRRAGLYMVPIQSKLHAEEAAYIITDCKARVLIVDAGLTHGAALIEQLPQLCPAVEHAFSLRGRLPGIRSWEDTILAMPAELISDPALGQWMAYSSGTTGKPKGIQQPLQDVPFDTPLAFAQLMARRYKSRAGTKFIVSAPLYHVGSLTQAIAEQCLGASVLLFEKFDAEAMLRAIEYYRPERGQFVPTMFIRMLKLSAEVRARYDVSSLKVAIHSAGPCPLETKRAMIEWWGPILEEIYGGTENAGSTLISSEEWLRKPGSVGRPSSGSIHICDEHGSELPAGATGMIYFDAGASFQYLNDAAKTSGARHPQQPGWASFGDIGHVDEDGYLFLSDRKAFMIISGGVNIYPQEAENVLSMHPAVADVAVFGVPDTDLGERAMAVIEPVEWERAGPELEAALIAFCKSKLASLKCPKSIDFERKLPRDEAGKLAKRALRDRYWHTVNRTS
jgi:acyl-CoA synthetase (AMP-forming)/AMP-acid ligase II